MAGSGASEWNADAVRTWLQSRVVAARADQAVAERGGRARQDDCDKASAQEMVCSSFGSARSIADAQVFLDGLKALLDRDEYNWRGVHDDTRFDRHVRTFVRKLMKMAKANDGFANTAHYQ